MRHEIGDTGWRAESEGLFDFTYYVYVPKKGEPGTLVPIAKDAGYPIHPGVVRGLFQVKNIRDTTEVEPFSGSMKFPPSVEKTFLPPRAPSAIRKKSSFEFAAKVPRSTKSPGNNGSFAVRNNEPSSESDEPGLDVSGKTRTGSPPCRLLACELNARLL